MEQLPSEPLPVSGSTSGILPSLGSVFEIAYARLAPQVLNGSDEPWIQNLLPESTECTPDVLRKLNLTIARDIDLSRKKGREPERDKQALMARYEFFGDILQWSNPDHYMTGMYDKLQRKKPNLVPLRTFIDAQRVLHDEGLNNRTILSKYMPAAWTLAARFQRRIQEMREHALSTKLIEEAPGAFIAAKNIGERIMQIEGLCSVVERSTQVSEFVSEYPTVLLSSPEKNNLHILLLKRFGSPDRQNSSGLKYLTQPVDRHLRWVLKVASPEKYAEYASRSTAEIVAASWAGKLLGKDIVAQYEAYKVVSKR